MTTAETAPAVTLDHLTQEQKLILDWLSKEDSSSYGECRGESMDVLIAARLAEFITRDVRGDDFSRVALTEAGWQMANALAKARAP